MRPVVLPVIHYQSHEQAMRNAAIAFHAQSDGVFLIHMEGHDEVLAETAIAIKQAGPDKLVGINYLSLPPAHGVSANIAHGLDMTWTDRQLTHSEGGLWADADVVRECLTQDPSHLVFSGVAFKHQAEDPEPDVAAVKAVMMGFIPTTSGEATGVAAEVEKIAAMRAALGEQAPLAIASGITPENVHHYAPYLSHILVATGVSASFYEFDAEKLDQLVKNLLGEIMLSRR